MGTTIDCFGLTDRGRVRRINEDQFLIADLEKAMTITQTSLSDGERKHLSGAYHGKIMLVADGMGGRSGGEVASGLAVEAVAKYVLKTMPWFFRLRDGREGDLEHELKAALEECQRIVESAAANNGHRQMGTTLTLAYILWPRLYVVHAGDSRCYLIRDGRVEQITHDHTVAQKMVDRGMMSVEAAETSRWSHALWKCIGGGTGAIDADVYKAELKAGDALLLCSDGLSKYVPEATIAAALEADTARAAATTLVSLANDAGGDDNVTVVVARFPVEPDTTELPALAAAVPVV